MALRFNHPSYLNMLAVMSSSEWSGWLRHFQQPEAGTATDDSAMQEAMSGLSGVKRGTTHADA